MIICWDNLDKHRIHLSKNGNFRVFIGSQWKTFHYHTSCECCGEPFLSGKNQRFCCKSCSNKITTLIKMKNISYIDNIHKKGKTTKLKKYNNENYVNPIKAKQTKKNRYGDENYNNSIKTKQTCLKKYGVTCPLLHKDIQNKTKQTCLKKYGVENVFFLTDIQNKTKQTKLKKYGNENYNNREKYKQTCIKKYGVNHVSQVPEIYENVKSGYKNSWHEYILPSGKVINLQGYEPKAFDILLKKYNEQEIKYKKSDMPNIWYTGEDNKKHKYYPDFYIPSINTVIEVKSNYTYKKMYNINILKEQSTKNIGYKYNLMIL